VGDIEISFVEYSANKKVHLQLDIVEYSPEDQAPIYDLIIGKQTLPDLGVVLDFKEKTTQITRSSYPWGILPICNSNLALPGHLGRTLAWPRSQSVPAALPSVW
jgi:hypothetical protein